MRNPLKRSLLPIVEAIAGYARKSRGEFSPDIAEGDTIDDLAGFLGITAVQAWLFAVILELHFQRRVTIDTIADHLKSSVLKVIDFTDELYALEERMLIQRQTSHHRSRDFSGIRYSIPAYVVESLRTGDASLLRSDRNLNLPEFLERANEFFDDRIEEGGSARVYLAQLSKLIESNQSLSFVDYVNREVEEIENKCLVFWLAYHRMNRMRHYNTSVLIQNLFDNLGKRLEFECNIANGKNELIRQNIVRVQESDFKDGVNLVLSQSTVKALFSDYPELSGRADEAEEGIILAQDIKPKPLFFEKGLQAEMDKLTGLLQPEAFESFRKRLKEAGMPTGLTAVFSGSPGTGKTASAYQIARKTGRDILMVDLTEVRSKWYGESEKRVKSIFTSYREKCNTSGITPILLINEADGLFSKRLNLSEGSSSVDRTGNTMQNILLQELEDFEGILIATTNLGQNFDQAFERRFLFKIEFGQPTPEAMQMIWKDKLPILEPQHLELLSELSLSGGEIENVARRYMAEKVIDDMPLSIDRIRELCQSEKPAQQHREMGFRR